MNILYVVPYVPNLIRVRPYNLIQRLAERGHQVTLATIWTNERERTSLEQLRSSCCEVVAFHLPTWRSFWNCVTALPSGAPLQSIYSWNRSLAEELAGLAAQGNGRPAFDVLHVEHLRGARYGLFLKSQVARRRPSLPVVWDSVDSISLLFQQAMVRSKSPFSRGLTRFELGRTQRYEGRLLRQFERVLVTSAADRQALLSLLGADQPRPEVQVLRNGVDLDYFRPLDGLEREPATLVVSGKMSYHANVAMVLHLVEEIMPYVWGARPEVKVWIVGKDPASKIRELAQNPNIVVTGEVEDIRPYLRKATAAVAPIAYGAGIQNKVLEAMACGTPVVATPQAVSALDLRPGDDLLVAQEPAAFAQAILGMLEDPPLRQRIGQAGRRYVERQHDWAAVAAQLEGVYENLVQ